MIGRSGSPGAVHPRAIVDTGARLGSDVTVGPYAVIAAGVEIGERTSIGPFVFIDRNARIGCDCQLAPGVIIGAPPLDRHYRGEPTGVRIGDRTVIREYTTVHRATGDGNQTVIGDDAFIMAYIHIAHNCHVGNGVVITNGCQLAGHVEVGDHAVLGGMTGVHQFTRIGRLAMVGACSYLTRDLPPFLMGQGNRFRMLGVNLVWLRRRKFPVEKIRQIQTAFEIIYRKNFGRSDAIREIRQTVAATVEIEEMIVFLESSRRGVNLNVS